MEFLDHIVGQGIVCMDPAKVSTILDWPAPQTVKELQSFLGLANYYNWFIRAFANIAAPLHALLCIDPPFVWGVAQEKAFNDMKSALVSAPVLQLPDFSRDSVVDVDASNIAIGTIL